mgnify:CR=1 FL=1
MFPFSQLLPGSNGMRELDAIEHKTSSQSCNLAQYANLIKSCKILAQKRWQTDSLWQGLNGRIMNNKIFARFLSGWNNLHKQFVNDTSSISVYWSLSTTCFPSVRVGHSVASCVYFKSKIVYRHHYKIHVLGFTTNLQSTVKQKIDSSETSTAYVWLSTAAACCAWTALGSLHCKFETV